MSVDVEVAIPLPTDLPGNDQIRIRTLPGGLMACTVHPGDDLFLGQAYLAPYRWMKDNGYRLTGSPPQAYLHHTGKLDPSYYLTETPIPADHKAKCNVSSNSHLPA